MRKTLLLSLIASIFLGYLSSSLGVTLSLEIGSPKECPENLRVETQTSHDHEGLISVSVSFRPTAPELYRNRVRALGELMVKSGDRIVVVSNLESTQKAGAFKFMFQLARDAFRDSEFTISSQLYEKDGTATVGGGEVYRLHLKGFQPGEQSHAEQSVAPLPRAPQTGYSEGER